MAGVNKVVNITVNAASPGVTAPGFGVPLILSQNATFQERSRVYTRAADVATDFGAGSPEYNAANGIFSQQPAVQRIRIGKAPTNPTTQRWGVAVVLAGVIGLIYKLKVWKADGTNQTVSYTATTQNNAAFVESPENPIWINLNNLSGAFVVNMDAGADQTFTFGMGRDALTNTAGQAFAGASGSMTVRVDGNPLSDQTIVFAGGDYSSIDTFCDHVNVQSIGFKATVANAGTKLIVLRSDRFGSSAQVAILAISGALTADNGFSVSVGTVGQPTCTKTGGTGAKNVTIADMTRATPAEIVAAITLADGVTGGTIAVDVGTGLLRLQSATTGPGSSVQVKNTSVATLGFDTAVHNGNATGGADNDSIMAGLKAGIDALVGGPAITTSLIGAGGSKTLRAVANASTGWFALEIDNPALLKTYQDHDAPAGNGLTTDIQALARSSSDWYGLITLYNSPAYVLAVAAVVESLGAAGTPKLYVVDSADTDCATVAESTPATDILHQLKAANRSRTAGAFHQRAAEFFAACEMSRFFTIDPGDDNWRMKGLSGPTTGWMDGDELSDDQTTNLEDKNANYYIGLGVPTVLGDGKTAGGPLVFIDNLRGLDWLSAETGTDLFNLLYGVNKLPMTDAGGSAVKNVLLSEVQKGLKATLINPGSPPEIPAPTVFVPRIGTLSTADRQARNLKGTMMNFILAGAIDRIFVTINVQL